jgi:large subunit ribosomal protein L17
MRHLKAGRKLGRNASHRRALMRNLARSLILSPEGRIITTVEKAKEARRFVEKLITLGKKGTLHARRLALMHLPQREVIARLFTEIAPRYADRPGGYTRVIRRHERRLGDGGQTAFLELLKAGEVKVQRRPAAPPAPRVTPPRPQITEPQVPAAPAPTPPSPAPESSAAAPAPETQTPPPPQNPPTA